MPRANVEAIHASASQSLMIGLETIELYKFDNLHAFRIGDLSVHA